MNTLTHEESRRFAYLPFDKLNNLIWYALQNCQLTFPVMDLYDVTIVTAIKNIIHNVNGFTISFTPILDEGAPVVLLHHQQNMEVFSIVAFNNGHASAFTLLKHSPKITEVSSYPLVIRMLMKALQ